MFSRQDRRAIYLDYAATTPVSKRVFEHMQPYFSEKFGNPSSLHRMGQEAQSALDEARARIAELIGASWKEVFFTSSATESINTILQGVILAAKERGVEAPHIVTTNIEHSAVLAACRALEKWGVSVTYLPASAEGLVSPEQIKEALIENTVLVSVMYVNNEIGTIQPIREIAKVVSDYKLKTKNYNLFFHTDAVQAANYLSVNVQELGVDLMTLSSHKVYGPKGAALLYKKEGAALKPLLVGGEQERGMRAGTENVPAIVGFAEALAETSDLREEEARRVALLRDELIEGLINIDGVELNGSATERVANNVHISMEGIRTEVAIPFLDSRGIYASGGSACVARVPEPSHVVEALGKKERARNCIRFTLGRKTTQKDIRRAAEAVVELSTKQ